jgi:hypothetical protein
MYIMNSGFNPVVTRPSAFRVQTESGGFQKPFFFGGAQAPIALALPPNSFSGSGLKARKYSAMGGAVYQKDGDRVVTHRVVMPRTY